MCQELMGQLAASRAEAAEHDRAIQQRLQGLQCQLQDARSEGLDASTQNAQLKKDLEVVKINLGYMRQLSAAARTRPQLGYAKALSVTVPSPSCGTKDSMHSVAEVRISDI
jgi:hypothetical protein